MTQTVSRRLGKGVEYTCDALMLLAIAAIATLPWSIPFFTHHAPDAPNTLFYKYLVVLAVSGVVAILLLWQARGVMRNVNGGTPFVADTVRRLRIGATESLVLAAFHLVTIFWVQKLYMAMVLLAFGLIGMLLLVMAEMICQAIAYKEENDMTI